jgi:glycosyltransferase involved in cell wall biosynthesis
MRLTIVSPSAYPALVPGKIEFAGGAEFQLLMLARAMRDRGHEVSFVVGDYGQPALEEAQGFSMYRSFELFKGNRNLRFIPDMIKLRAALRESRPDVVNQRSTAFYTGQTCYFSHQVDAAFVFSLGIDYNCYPDLQGRARWPIPVLYGWGIRSAEMVLAQTKDQANLMRKNFGRDDVAVFPNLLEIPSIRSPEENRGYVLWVGSLARRKRPEMFLDLARRCPGTEFRLVGGAGEDPGYDSEIRTAAESIPNLNYVGFVSPPQMDEQYRGAALYVNTSGLEGLPNAFLQSWAHGVPTVSAEVDPDGVIASKELGGVERAPDGLAALVSSLLADPEARLAAGRRGYEHVKSHHAIESVGDLAEEYLLRAVQKRSASGSGTT